MSQSRTPVRILASTTAARAISAELSRRRFLAAAAAAGATGLLAACSTGGGTSSAPQATGGELEDSLSIYTWGDYDAPDVLDTRGFVNLRLGRADDAIKDYDAALKLDPKLAGALYGRGLAKMRKGDRAGGSADVAAAKRIRSDIAEEFSRYGVR